MTDGLVNFFTNGDLKEMNHRKNNIYNKTQQDRVPTISTGFNKKKSKSETNSMNQKYR